MQRQCIHHRITYNVENRSTKKLQMCVDQRELVKRLSAAVVGASKIVRNQQTADVTVKLYCVRR